MAKKLTLFAGIALLGLGAYALLGILVNIARFSGVTITGVHPYSGPITIPLNNFVFIDLFLSIGMVVGGLLLVIDGARSEA